MEMANEPPASRPLIFMAAPYLVGLLIAAHVFALEYWICRLVSEKQSQRRKARRIE